MRIAIFIDLENFKQGIWKVHRRREPKYGDMHFFLFNDIVKILGWDKYTPRLIRAYLYTGEYTDTLIKKIEYKLSNPKLNSYYQRKIKEDLENANRRKAAQEKLFEWCIECNFMELKTTPLKYEPAQGIYQKGVDVLIATDLMSHAYQNTFDAAILCSGDLDLLESIKVVKNLGKKVILVAHRDDTSKNIIKISDYFYDLKSLDATQIDGISETYDRNNKASSDNSAVIVSSQTT